ncbi:MAG: isoprenylcysteine carboxylmethyltransferase family protein [Propionibacteriaceae bacterium]|nr:isoprenylcysteine carboxylmethyltransferase family protein [Propionibacteriaceae bacterium]
MNTIQIITLVLLGVFYVAYFTKALVLQRRGICVNLLGEGKKPPQALVVERLLRVATAIGAVIQCVSTGFPHLLWSLDPKLPLEITGLVLMAIGILVFILAMVVMRDNWRAGFTEDQNTSLITTGIYRFSRNPAFIGFDLLYIGCAAAFPNILNLLWALGCIALFHIQILGEEKYCTEAFGREYIDYCTRVRRYF